MHLDQLEKELRDALAHVYDPTYEAVAPLRTLLGCDSTEDPECVSAALRQAIETLRPQPDVPVGARARRLYELLHLRFVASLTQDDTSERLGLTTRHLRREEKEAVRLLARRLFDLVHTPAESGTRADGQPAPTPLATPSLEEWSAQLELELASLQRTGPAGAASLAEALSAAVDRLATVAARHGIRLVAEDTPTNLFVAMHPFALLQVLVMAISASMERMDAGDLALAGEAAGSRVVVTVSGSGIGQDAELDLTASREILRVQGGSIEATLHGGEFSLRIELPKMDRIVVLVIDDNADLVYVYRRYTTDTRYLIEHLADGRQVFERVEAINPRIIVLDIMLPDTDGWGLLSALHEHPATRRIPIIICSVIKGQELALALGAVRYLPKPVSGPQFIQALDETAAAVGT